MVDRKNKIRCLAGSIGGMAGPVTPVRLVTRAGGHSGRSFRRSGGR